MGIGFRELIVLMMLFVVLFVLGAVWLFRRLGKRSSSQAGRRPIPDRLAELETLRRAGLISTEEYEKQRASIISRV
jgi:hypothetical protein